MAGGNTPGWRKAFNKAERAVGEPLEKAIETREFANMMSVGAKVRKVFQRQIYGTVNRTLHFVGLSTLKDTRDIARQLNRVQAQLRDVSSQLEYLEEREQEREESETSDRLDNRGPGPVLPHRAGATADTDGVKAPAKKAAPVKKAVPAKKAAPAKKTTPAKKTGPVKKTSPAESTSAVEPSPDPLAEDATPADVPANPPGETSTPTNATPEKTTAPGTPAQNDIKGA